MKALDIMTSPVVTVRPDTSISDAALLVIHHHIGTLPVTDDAERLIGVVTEADLFRALTDRLGIGIDRSARRHPHRTPEQVLDITHRVVVWVEPEDSVSLCLHLMASHEGRSLPVAHHRRVIGIISRSDAMRELSGPDAPNFDRECGALPCAQRLV